MRSERRSISLDNRRSDIWIGASSPLRAFLDSHDGDEDEVEDDVEDEVGGQGHQVQLLEAMGSQVVGWVTSQP